MRPHVTLKQLRYFDALAREQHFGRAAEACSITQPALSMQITELEQQLGLVLVERTRSGVLLSDKGREIAARAARILCDVNEMIDFALHANKVLAGSLRLGVIPSIAPYMLPPLLPLLREGYPTLELHVRETQTLLLMQELTEGKLDVVLLALPITQADIETMPLFDDHFLLALPKSKKLASRVRATKDLIEHERLLLLEEGHCLREQALTYCSLQQSSAVNTFGVSSLSTIVEMVAAGYGITLLPEMCLNVEARGRDIGITRFVEPQPLRTVGLAWRATSPRADDFRELGRLIKLAWSKACTPPVQTETAQDSAALESSVSTNAQKS
ncbi:hydrogen peroxide-inducible genes activator [Hyphomicrobium sulfonivorans]|uniref:hydrogen peroxide-inducible genes activator n=1 Tax=Hyphomicrobium sulfonivorans TaxID=121290 RepID=UPI00156FD59A|nr:hydrogen peroxide-inducible genes activator [Hyphomicrobium sulfonivorans]MBI1649364.1 hydrogen peroxide-inducible genes activator [Hyphomicrobium sulfonivorans]NSL71282.1 LysR family transcriptional regulator [Hyphomicrobium sulfonivorans]